MNIQDLWARCEFCSICQDTRRIIKVGLGPDRAFRDTDFLKEENLFHLKTYWKLKQLRYLVQYEINCLTNKFKMVIADETDTEMDADKSMAEERLYRRVDRSDAYFWLDGNCHKCSSHIHSHDISLHMRTERLGDISIERETFRLLDQYEVTLYPDQNEMSIAKLEQPSISWLENKTGDSAPHYPKSFTYPLAELDFSNPHKAIERIETIITFS